MATQQLDTTRFDRTKVSFLARGVPLASMTDLRIDERPRAGDLVLARIESIGHHTRIDLSTGRRTTLFKDDRAVLVYGSRYSPDQFESEVPDDLGACHIAAAGGLASAVVSKRNGMREPTVIEPIGLVAGPDGEVINTADHGLAPAQSHHSVPTIAVIGTSMNSGKTTTVASLVYGLKNAGLKVGAAKVTGTGGGNDFYRFVDSGAHRVYDFTDAGFPSTYQLEPKVVEGIMTTLTSRLVSSGCEVLVLEIADGVLQGETAALIESQTFRNSVDGIVFAARDALGAVAGVRRLEELGLPVLGVSGICGDSPLAAKEARDSLGVTTYPMADLMGLQSVSELLGSDRGMTQDSSA